MRFEEEHHDHIHLHSENRHSPSADCCIVLGSDQMDRHSHAEEDIVLVVAVYSWVLLIAVLDVVAFRHIADSMKREYPGSHQESEVVDCSQLESHQTLLPVLAACPYPTTEVRTAQ